MIFVLSVLLTYFICLPGLYVILRLRLGANVLEVIAGGFFLGFALVVLLYEALSWYLPVPIIDYLLWSGSTVALIVGIRELNIGSVSQYGLLATTFRCSSSGSPCYSCSFLLSAI